MKKQLRFCSAYVTDELTVEAVNFHDAGYNCIASFIFDDAPAHTIYALTSYSSVVALLDFDTNTLYLLPRWDYSRTTISHVRKFIEDYTYYSPMCAADIRAGKSAFILADGYYDKYSDHLHKC